MGLDNPSVVASGHVRIKGIPLRDLALFQKPSALHPRFTEPGPGLKARLGRDPFLPARPQAQAMHAFFKDMHLERHLRFAEGHGIKQAVLGRNGRVLGRVGQERGGGVRASPGSRSRSCARTAGSGFSPSRFVAEPPWANSVASATTG